MLIALGAKKSEKYAPPHVGDLPQDLPTQETQLPSFEVSHFSGPSSASTSELKPSHDFTASETWLSTFLVPGSEQSLQCRLSFQELHLGLKGAAKQLEPLQMRL